MSDPVPMQTVRVQHSLGELGWTNLKPDGSQTETYANIDRVGPFAWLVTVGRAWPKGSTAGCDELPIVLRFSPS
jgi:hypothetical protein